VEIWPALRDGLKHISPNYERQLGPVWVGVFILGTASLIAFTKPEELGVGLTASANKSAEFFKDNHLKGPILNDTDIGSYLIYELYPGEQVFTDNRFGDAYSRSFFADVYLPMFRDESKWPVAFKKYNFNTLFFYHYDDLEGLRGFMFNRIYDRTWAWVYADQYAVIFVRNTPENADVIKKYQIPPDNFLERMKALSDSSDARDELAAADLFNLAGRTDLSMPIYWKYVSLWPDNGKVWFCMGKTELTIVDRAKANPYLAALYLERAIKEGWKTWQTYSFLSLAYFRTGQIERARETLKEENSIDPNSTYIQEDVASLSKMYGVTTPIKLDTPGALLKTP
jgi:tetratricopeptide (TPR) repeat protein